MYLSLFGVIILSLAGRGLLSFHWQREVFYTKERGAEHKQLCYNNQYQTVDNSLRCCTP